ncbi:MAG: ATP-binding protein, partial [Bacteroidales bacterium]|nr:ATP-binding protein [Bacteroidales bacterium]
SKSVMSWFQSDCNVVSGINNENYRAFTKTSFLERTEESHRALQLFKKLQLGFNDLTARKRDEDSHIPERLSPQARERKILKSIIIESTHNVYGESGLVCDERVFPFEERESDGTRKLFDMSGPIFDTLQRGAVLFVDELDAKMHPLISQQIIMLFNNPKYNPNKAQLIFTTHDTNLLSSHLLRRDQIWFTEKDSQEQTDLYSMMDIQFADGTKPRNDSNYEKNYIAGRYGAIPYIIND